MMQAGRMQVVGGELVVARRNPAAVFDLVEKAFDPVAGAVEIRAEADWIAAIAFWRDVAHAPFFMASSLIQSAS